MRNRYLKRILVAGVLAWGMLLLIAMPFVYDMPIFYKRVSITLALYCVLEAIFGLIKYGLVPLFTHLNRKYVSIRGKHNEK